MRASVSLKTTLAAGNHTAQRRPKSRGAPAWVMAVGLGFLTLSLTGSILINPELVGLYHFVFAYLTLPVFIISYLVTWFGMPRWRQTASPLKTLAAPALVSLVILLTCSGSVNYVNALLGTGESIQFSGPVTQLKYSSGRSGRSYRVVIADAATGHPREFRITKAEYLGLKVGDPFSRTLKQGGLGYAYQWR